MEHSRIEEVAPAPGFNVVHAPNRVDLSDKGRSIFLAGSIEKDKNSVHWQTSVADKLSSLPVTILDPLRPDWDSSWVEDKSFELFRVQVEWEQDMLEAADVIALYFAREPLAPISLLEMGLSARSGKLIVACHPEYKRRGYVQIICERLKIEVVDTLDELVQRVGQKLRGLDTVVEIGTKTIESEKLSSIKQQPLITVSEKAIYGSLGMVKDTLGVNL